MNQNTFDGMQKAPEYASPVCPDDQNMYCPHHPVSGS